MLLAFSSGRSAPSVSFASIDKNHSFFFFGQSNSFIIFLVAPRIEQYYVYFTFAWIWYPLCVGATLSTIGLVCARPNAFASLTPQRGKPPSLALRLGITPTLVNWFLLVLVPISIGLGIAVPSAQHEAKFLRAVHLWHQFGKDWNSPTTTTTELSREMLIDAQRVWYTFLESMYHVSTCLIVYSAWALLILLLTLAAYMPLIWMLFKQIRSYILDVRRSKSTSASNQAETQGKAKFTVRNMISRCSQVLGSSPPSSSDVEAQESAVQVTSMYFTEQEIRDQNTPSRNFFPAVKPSAFDRVRPGLDAERSKEEHVLKLFKSTFVQVCESEAVPKDVFAQLTDQICHTLPCMPSVSMIRVHRRSPGRHCHLL